MRVLAETDPSSLMEGLVIRVERDGVVQARRKFVRRGFLAAVERAGEHWLDRPIVPNQLAPGVDPFALAPGGVTDD
jgi:hypothetical protein